MNNIEELQGLLRSRHSLMYMVTHEEDRALRNIIDVATSMEHTVYTWSFTSGIKCVAASPKVNPSQKLKDGTSKNNPMEILEMIKDTGHDSIFVLKDYHAYLKEAEVSRLLKDVLGEIRTTYTPVVIVSPVLRVPVELEKLTTVMDYVLPVKDEILAVLNDAIEAIRDKSPEYAPSEEVINGIIRACQGLTLTEIENVISRSYMEHGEIKPETVNSAKKQIIRKSGILEFIEVEENMNEVGGMNILKEWLAQRRVAFSEAARNFGLPTPKGLLLFGVPGCGKSLVCKAVSKYWNMPLLRLDVGAVMQGLVGSSEENMRKVIQTAEALQPCILWVDEIEKGFSGTASSNFSDSGTTSRVFSTFITWLNEKKSEVFVVATANDIAQLPPELMRKGRFDEIFFVDLPNFEERADIFRIHLGKVKRDPSKFNLSTLAENSDGFSGADIQEAVTSALFDVFVNDAGTSDISDFNILNAISKTVPLSKVMSSQIAKIRELSQSKRARLASS